MVKEVNKIIYNSLASGKNLYLTGIGSLVIERLGAKRQTRKFVEQPRKIIAFTEQQKGTPLEEEIARTGNIDAEKAHYIFEQWLIQVLDGDTLNIDGVGTLRHDKFTMTDAFADSLNRQGRERVAIKTRSNGVLYIFASVCCLFALCVAGYVWFENNGNNISIPFLRNTDNTSAASADKQLANTAADKTKTEDAIINTDTLAAAPIDSESDAPNTEMPDEATTATAVGTKPETELSNAAPATERSSSEVQKPAETQKPNNTIFDSVSGRSYVVLGVYSTPENAFRAVGIAQKRMSDADCTVYRYGTKYMVSIYNSDNREQAVRYMAAVSPTFKDLWVYTKK